ncbi:MAG: hypothetical protein GFH27_549279n154 [Chloroflexi bacterium AL-W]|nr:hypothetical protein [Chloroflexi bacterium AL-N1]NOK65120.1 hypothetical protein [Chloroflexi bacterium AL-N10]NOK72613.1 hypothetical protein [Chloroflexi bacterium AL-N5]NOK79299.1 hypothetical protein [Chloroflexi bacterium AL-W]NOK87215.1 hypothetical protein [Chloroflexi bacterium AL-N15]
MGRVLNRLSSLAYLARPLALAFVGIVLLSLGAAYFLIAAYREVPLPPVFYFLTLQFLEARWIRGLILLIAGGGVLLVGMWQLSGVVVIPLHASASGEDELVVGYRQAAVSPRITALSGGAGILILANLGRYAQQLMCVTPLQDPVEYYYRAASLFNFENVIYVVPTPERVQVDVQLNDQTHHNVKHVPHDEQLAAQHVADMRLTDSQGQAINVAVTRQTIDSLRDADAIILGPGSLFESIIPNLLITEIRETIAQSKAQTIYICNLMTEPGLTTGFSVADHVRQIIRFGGFAPDYVLVNAQRIEPEIRQLYETANQMPVYLNPEEYEETIVSATDRRVTHDVVVEGSIVIEADLASSVIQSVASLEHPGAVRAVRVLRHDPEKLTSAIMGILRRS